jgi:hypothetical protein
MRTGVAATCQTLQKAWGNNKESLGKKLPLWRRRLPLSNPIRCLLEILLCPDHEHFLGRHNRRQGGVRSDPSQSTADRQCSSTIHARLASIMFHANGRSFFSPMSTVGANVPWTAIRLAGDDTMVLEY